MSKTADPSRATSREWLGLAVIALPCMLYSMDLTVLNLAVPHLSADLRPGAAQLLWIVDIYGFLVAGFLVTMGTLGDRIGRRRLLLIGACAFGLASILAAFSRSAEMLIFARAVLGVAAATLAPSTLSLIRNMFLDAQQRTFAIGIWIASFSAGGAIGPLVGGAMLEHFWWGSVFLIAVPIMVLLLVLGPALLPEYRDENAGRLDLTSVVLSLVAVLAVVYGIKRFAEVGLQWPAGLAVVAGLVAGALFVRRQRSLADPLVDLKLFRLPVFSASLAINLLSFLVAFSSLLLIAQYLQLVLGMGPLEAGLWTVPSGLAFVAGSMLAPAAVRRFHPSTVMGAGLSLAALGFAALSRIDANGGIAFLVTAFVLLSLGLAPVVTLTTDLVVGSVPPERAGTASGMSETSSELGGALGIAIMGSIVTAVYRGRLRSAVPPGASSQATEAAQDTLGGALATARELPDQLGETLIVVAREAFTDGLQLAAAIGTLILAVLVVLCSTLLRRAHRPAATAA